MSIEETVWTFFIHKGLGEKSVAAIMGNIEAESEFNENLIEVGSGVGFGLIQWSYERRTQLENYGTDLNHQLEFLWAEFTGDTGNTGAEYNWKNKNGYLNHDEFMKGNSAIEDLTSSFCFCFERPGIPHLSRRQQSALKYYNQFSGTSHNYVSDSSNTSDSDSIYDNTLYRAFDKDGIYRVYKIQISGDTRGNDWYIVADAVSQAGGTIPIIRN